MNQSDSTTAVVLVADQPDRNGRIYSRESLEQALRARGAQDVRVRIEGDTAYFDYYYQFPRPISRIELTYSIGTRVPGRTRYQILLDNQ